ncbi:MAG: hypothetical protein Q9183_007001, partial [Haloplaca sp. 2 TL-2023]
MLDSFEIVTTSGVVLWSKAYAPVSSSLINGFIKDVFIEEKLLPGAKAADDTSATQHPSYNKEKYTLRWASVKELGLIFVVRMPAVGTSLKAHILIWIQAVYQSLLHLSWVDKLLDNIRVIFVDLYGDQLRKPHSTVVECDFDGYFDQQVKELEGSAKDTPQRNPQITQNDSTPTADPTEKPEEPSPPVPGLLSDRQHLKSPSTSTDVTPNSTPDTSRPVTPSNGHLLSAKPARGGGVSRRARKAASAAQTPAIEELKKKDQSAKAKGKK